MGKYILAYDLGTGGNKASLYNVDGFCLSKTFTPYRTHYPNLGWHEQNVDDWWNAIILSTKKLLNKSKIDPNEIECCGISGHSLGVVPLDKNGYILKKNVPIWSDSRAKKQATIFFNKIDEISWYKITGNGFPPYLYSIFKVLWYKDNDPEIFKKIYKVIGTKDFINYKLTGKIYTDYSYASGCGAYNLLNWDYDDNLLNAAGLSREIFPEIVPSTQIIGELTKEAANALNLPKKMKIVCGGVDNSCMALGARNIKEGRVYNSLGSSSWIAVSSSKPLIESESRPYIFAHVIPGMFTSAVAIFSAGSSFEWAKNQLCKNLIKRAYDRNTDPYEEMTTLAQKSKIGSNKLIFEPSLAGGTFLDYDFNIKGAFVGLDLRHNQSDIIRCTMEGIAMKLNIVLSKLKELTNLSNEILVVGGGSRSDFWCQIFADIYNVSVLRSNIGQQAAALGAASIAAVGSGLWSDFNKIDKINEVKSIVKPIPMNVKKYKKIFTVFKEVNKYQSKIGKLLSNIDV